MDDDQRDELIARTDERIKLLSDKLHAFVESAHRAFVTKDEFRPVRLVVYGMASIILAGFIMTLLEVIHNGFGN